MITERSLKQWRKEALKNIESFPKYVLSGEETHPSIENENRILRMTQELLDQHLLRRKD